MKDVDALIEEMAQDMAASEGISLPDTRMAGAYRALARVALNTVLKAGVATESYGLQHSNGHIHQCSSLAEAQELKSGQRVHGRRGAWKDHTLVAQTSTTVVSATPWVPVEP